MPQTLKSLKTPLRYPGGKSRALSKLLQYIPDLKEFEEYREPFLGGGSVALEVSKRYPRLEIWVNDLYEPLYNFWREVQDHGYEIKNVYSNLNKGTVTILPPRNSFLMPSNILKDLWKTVKISIVLFLSMWLISVLSRDSQNHPPSPNKQVTVTSPLLASIDLLNIKS